MEKKNTFKTALFGAKENIIFFFALLSASISISLYTIFCGDGIGLIFASLFIWFCFALVCLDIRNTKNDLNNNTSR